MNNLTPQEIFDYFQTIEAESKEYSIDGEVSYPYLAGIFQAMLSDTLISQESRDLTISRIKNKLKQESK